MAKVPIDTRGIWQRLRYMRGVVKQNGGYLQSLKIALRTDDLKQGEHVGTDEFGNKYYFNPRYFLGRSRWVVYSENVGLDYNASSIPPEWHRWLHYIGDDTPVSKPPDKQKWVQQHRENFTGSSGAYVPYSTTTPKIEMWQPPK